METSEHLLIYILFLIAGGVLGWMKDYEVILTIVLLILCIYGMIKLTGIKYDN